MKWMFGRFVTVVAKSPILLNVVGPGAAPGGPGVWGGPRGGVGRGPWQTLAPIPTGRGCSVLPSELHVLQDPQCMGRQNDRRAVDADEVADDRLLVDVPESHGEPWPVLVGGGRPTTRL